MATPEKKLFSPSVKNCASMGMKSPQQSFLYSPGWKNRSFKLKKKNRVSSLSSVSQSSTPLASEKMSYGKENSLNKGSHIKRKNPFAFLTDKKRFCPEELDISGIEPQPQQEKLPNTSDSSPFSGPQKTSTLLLSPGPTSPTLFDDESPQLPQRQKRVSFNDGCDFSQPVSLLENENSTPCKNKTMCSTPVGKQTKVFEYIPRHSALRNKLKIISDYPLSHLKDSTQVFEPTTHLSSNSSMTNICSFWSHPYIPWLKMFPRLNSNSSQNPSQDVSFLTDSIKNSIYSAWNMSFQSAYDLLRSNYLNMFFLCSSNMTMCFERRESSCAIGNNKASYQLCVSIVPTTRGFRDTLFKQNIKFFMPHLDKLPNDQKVSVLTSSVSNLKGEKLKDCSEVDHESGSGMDLDSSRDDLDTLQDQSSFQDWLNCLGAEEVRVCSQKSTQTLDQEFKYDYTKQSAIVIPSESVHKFFNFLLNFKSLIPSSGSLAGLPPTILSDKAFSGATLQQLSTKCCSFRTANFKGIEKANKHAFEVYGGPILPSLFNIIIHKVRDECGASCVFECHSTFAENSDAFDHLNYVPATFVCRNKFFEVEVDDSS